MRALLDTNILIHREASKVAREDIGVLFNWLDRLKYEKMVHPLSLAELMKHADKTVVATMRAKALSYSVLKTEAPETEEIRLLRSKHDRGRNDAIDTSLLKEVFGQRVDCLITEDRAIHEKASVLGIADRVFTIDDFLEKVTAENPELADYKVLAVKKEYFGNIDLSDQFFDSFRSDYVGFDRWFNRKADDIAYVCKDEGGRLVAFLYLKSERAEESYSDIEPPFTRKRRLKIGTFKVVSNGFKLGERFLKIAFDNALRFEVDELYVTIFNKTEEHERLVKLLLDFGFQLHGIKRSESGEEEVYTRDFSPRVNVAHPCLTYPYMSGQRRKFVVPIYPAYHTELLPDSILRTESATDFVESRPNRNAIRKVYISRSIKRDISKGDVLIFYRTASGGPAHYTSVATTVALVDEVIPKVDDVEQFVRLCRRRSVFSDADLVKHWNWNKSNRPFIVNFLYVHSLPKRLNLAALKDLGILSEAPRGFEEIGDPAFRKLMEESGANTRLVVD